VIWAQTRTPAPHLSTHTNPNRCRSSPQASPHLAQLLLRLNFNDFFLQPRAEGDVLKPMHDTGVR
jgi:hypothetical protein